MTQAREPSLSMSLGFQIEDLPKVYVGLSVGIANLLDKGILPPTIVQTEDIRATRKLHADLRGQWFIQRDLSLSLSLSLSLYILLHLVGQPLHKDLSLSLSLYLQSRLVDQAYSPY